MDATSVRKIDETTMPRLSMDGPFGGRVEYEFDFQFSLSELGSCGSISDIITCPFRPGCSLDDKCGKCGCDDFLSETGEHTNPPLALLCIANELCRGKKAMITIEKPDGSIYILEHDCGEWDAPNLFQAPADYDPINDRTFVTCLPRY